MDYEAIANDNCILKAPMGSTLYGTNIDEQGSDEDHMGVCIEPIEAIVGFKEFDQFIHRTATERTGKNDEPSQPGDLDLTIYGLRKFLRLAMHGNPTVVQMLFVPEKSCIIKTPEGASLQGLAPLIISRQAGKRFLGYMEAQRQRLLGERGQKKTNRPELEEAYGFDTKYAAHILRLGIQGVELLETGRITLPMKDEDRDYIKSVRKGQVPIQGVLTRAGELETELKDLLDNSPLPPTPDETRVEKWLLDQYSHRWRYNINNWIAPWSEATRTRSLGVGDLSF